MGILNTGEVEKEYGINTSGNTDYYKFSEGENKFRLLSAPIVMPQHYNKGGYMGVCIGKENSCPGCKHDDEVTRMKEQDKEGNKSLQVSRNVRWMCWVLDHKDNVVKLAMLPHKVAKQLEALLDDPEYAVESCPLPFDLNLTAKNAGTTKVEYMLRAARSNTPIAPAVLDIYHKQSPCDEILEKMKEKKKKELGVAPKSEEKWPDEEINPEDIPL